MAKNHSIFPDSKNDKLVNYNTIRSQDKISDMNEGNSGIAKMIKFTVLTVMYSLIWRFNVQWQAYRKNSL